MQVDRRDFLKASSAVAAALGLHVTGIFGSRDAVALEAASGGVPVVWLQAQTCTGCSVSFLNSVYYTTVDDLLLNKLDVDFHPNIMTASGKPASDAAEATRLKGGYVLVVEGAVPTGANGEFAYLWEGLKASDGIAQYAANAAFIIAAGTCASFGGIYAGAPNPTGAQGLPATYGSKRVIKIPGCPIHPDWLVGTIAYIMKNGKAPTLDSLGRPTDYYSRTVHSRCPYADEDDDRARVLGQQGCLRGLGCCGPETKADCPSRRWNSPGAGQPGGNWCIGAGAPCYNCTEPGFPDKMAPFFTASRPSVDD